MLTSLALIFLLGLLLGQIFNKLKLPRLVGMILGGIILGPYGLDLLNIHILEISPDLRQLALIIILTRAGLALNVEDLKKVGRPAILMCFLPATFEILGMILIAPRLLGISVIDAAIMGAVVGAVSPAVIVPRMLKLIDEGYGEERSIPQLIMAGASVDDIFVIVLFTSFTALAQGEKASVMALVNIPISIVLGILLGMISGVILTEIFKRYHMGDSIKVLIILSVSFLFVEIENMTKGFFPISGLIAVMAMGATFLKKYNILAERLSQRFSKLWVGAEILLFVLVGATVDVSYSIAAGFSAVIVIIGALIFREIGVFCCLLKTKLNKKERLFCLMAYTPKATVQAAIGGIPLAMGLSCGKIVLTVAVLAILITAPLGALAIDASYKRLLNKKDCGEELEEIS